MDEGKTSGNTALEGTVGPRGRQYQPTSSRSQGSESSRGVISQFSLKEEEDEEDDDEDLKERTREEATKFSRVVLNSWAAGDTSK